MINITSIKSPQYNQNKPLADIQSKPNFVQKSDSFELRAKHISFKGIENKINLRFPIKAAEELFTKTYDEIITATAVDEKIKLTDNCINQFKEIISKSGQYSHQELGKVRYQFMGDRAHEIVNPLSELNFFIATAIHGKEENPLACDKFDKFCKYSFDRTLNGIKRYESFLDKGLENNTMKPQDVFKLALDSASEKAKSKNIKIKTKGDGLLKNNKNGILSTDGKINDYKLYTIFSNLIQNSAKYSPANSTIITKFEKKVINNEKYLVFSVTDQGIGIPKAEQMNVLNGNRATNAIDSGIEGTGYGLNRVNKMLAFIDSHLKIESPINPKNKEFPGSEISCYIKLEDKKTSFFNREIFHGLFT